MYAVILSNTIKVNFSYIISMLILLTAASTCALKCYKCDGNECMTGKGEIEECSMEKPVCAQYIDLTGESTGKVGSVFKRYCEEGSEGMTFLCKCLTPNWDECMCAGHLCNGHLPPCKIRNFGENGHDGGCRK